jgi:predicted amidophosphoribosyltransferase
MRLEGKTFVLKEQQFLQDKCILLVDDVMTTGSTLKKCAEALREDYPEKIYGITLCRAIN